MNHTPTPWARPPGAVTGDRADAIIRPKPYYVFIGTKDGSDPRFPDDFNLVALVPHGSGDAYKAIDDADFIVRAVNAHHDLVEALQVAHDTIKVLSPPGHLPVLSLAMIIDALAKAKGDTAPGPRDEGVGTVAVEVPTPEAGDRN